METPDRPRRPRPAGTRPPRTRKGPARAPRPAPGPRSGPGPRRRLGLGLALLAALSGGCALPPEAGVVEVESGVPERPRLRFLDGQLSANRSCAIRRGNRLDPRIPPVRVNGVPIGFC